MGTNYYLRYNECQCCGRYDEVHIGKSSFGWRFAWHGYTEAPAGLHPIKSVADWRDAIKKGTIYNEYGEKQDADTFIQTRLAIPRDGFKCPIGALESGRIYEQAYIEARLSSGEAWFSPEQEAFYGTEFS